MNPVQRTESVDRRDFLRASGLGMLAWCFGCARDRTETREPGDAPPPRPILIPWGHDGVLITAPALERPAAYVSRGTQRVYVDHDLRDRAAVALAAHISVSTGLWRIPLPGDPPRAPVQPGDAPREFEERPLSEWDPTAASAEGDARLFLGAPRVATVALDCDIVSGTELRCSGGPWSVARAMPGGDGLVRELLGSIGDASVWDDRGCGGRPRTVRVVTWAAPGDAAD